MFTFDGKWKVRREGGLLLPFGIRKTIRDGRGWTKLAFLPLLPFRVEGLTLQYRALPLRDEIQMQGDGSLGGAAYFLGLPICRFRLEPA
jgi:hypothetical protein